jgi:FKBP-type peptidyl-prolyl cis-trans isomerase
MKKVRSLLVVCLAGSLFSSFADPQYDPNAPIKPLSTPDKPDREKTSYAIGMNLGLQRKQAKSDADIDAFAKGLTEVFQNKPTEFPFTDTMTYLNAMRTKGENATAKDKRQFAYAMGMRWGSNLKESAPDCDTSVVIAAMKDVADGKPLKLKESEMQPLLEQGREYSLYLLGATNRTAGAAYLDKVSKETGVKKLADGLYYRVITEGSGRACKTLKDGEEVLFIRYKGSFLDGREFDHHNRFPKSLNGGWPAWSLAVKQMKLGDKWQVYSAPQYSFGREGDPVNKVGPDSTVIWDIEIREFVKNDDPRLGSGRLGHGIAGRDNDDDLKELGKEHPIEFKRN